MAGAIDLIYPPKIIAIVNEFNHHWTGFQANEWLNNLKIISILWNHLIVQIYYREDDHGQNFLETDFLSCNEFGI